MGAGGGHFEIFKAAETLRPADSLRSIIAAFILRAFLGAYLLGGFVLLLLGALYCAGTAASFIVHSISIVPR